MDATLPAFIDIPEKDQAMEIRQYLISAGTDLNSDTKENIHEELASLLDATDNWLKSASDADLEAMMNSFISLILVCAFDNDKLTRKFCNKLTEIGTSNSNALLRIKILNNLFSGLPEDNNLRYDVYLSQVKIAARFGHTSAVQTQLKEVQQMLEKWKVSTEQKRVLYRELHAALIQLSREEASKVMLELLSTYDEQSAALAREDAEKCMLDFIGNPTVFIMDHVLSLKPVEAMKGMLIHKLLMIFVSGRLSDYLEFYSQNMEFVNSTGLDHEANMSKMRILTFLTLASQQNEIGYTELIDLMAINEDEIEEFIIGLVQSGLVHAKMDQLNRKIIIRSSSRRAFGKPEWTELREKLEAWRENLLVIRSSLENLVVKPE